MNIYKLIDNVNDKLIKIILMITIVPILTGIYTIGFIMYWGYGGEYCPKLLENLYREEIRQVYQVLACFLTGVIPVVLWVILVLHSKDKLREEKNE